MPLAGTESTARTRGCSRSVPSLADATATENVWFVAKEGPAFAVHGCQREVSAGRSPRVEVDLRRQTRTRHLRRRSGSCEETDASQLVRSGFSSADRRVLDEILGIAHQLLRPEGWWTDSTGTSAALPRSPASICGDLLSVRQNPNSMSARCPLAAGTAIRPSSRRCRRSVDGLWLS